MTVISGVANLECLLSETFELVLTSADRVRQKEVLHVGVIITNSASVAPLPVNSAPPWQESRLPLNASVGGPFSAKEVSTTIPGCKLGC